MTGIRGFLLDDAPDVVKDVARVWEHGDMRAAGRVLSRTMTGGPAGAMLAAGEVANYLEDKETGMGAALLGAGISAAKSLFKKKAKKTAVKIATNVASNLASDAISGGISYAVQKYTGGGSLPNVAPANFGMPQLPYNPGNLGNVVGTIVNYATGGGGGTAIQRHKGAVALPDGTIWYRGHLYVYRQTASGGRMMRVTRDRRTGAIIPAPKHMNVLNPHALSRSMRRVEGFHRVASSAIKHMEKWARKTQHKRAPSRAPKRKK